MQLLAITLISLLLVTTIVATPWVSSQDGTIPDPGGVAVIATSPEGTPLVSVVSLPNASNPSSNQTTVLVGSVIAQTPSNDGSSVLEGVSAFPVSSSGTVSTFDPVPLSGWSSNLLEDLISGEKDVNESGLFELLCLTSDGRWSGQEVVVSEFVLTPIVDADGSIVDYTVTTSIQVVQHGVCAIFVERGDNANIDVQRRADVNNPQQVTGQGGISGDPEESLINYYDETDFTP